MQQARLEARYRLPRTRYSLTRPDWNRTLDWQTAGREWWNGRERELETWVKGGSGRLRREKVWDRRERIGS